MTADSAPPPSAPSAAPEEVLITPRRARLGVDLAEMWRYRDLFRYLSWRNIAVRYKQTLFGVLWAILQPVLQSGVFAVFLGALAEVPSEGRPYFLFTLAGMLPWSCFRNAVGNASESVVQNARMVSKVYFPRLWIPVSGVTVAAVDFLVAFVAFLGILLYYHLGRGMPLTLGWSLLLVPALLGLLLVIALGVGTLLTAINVRFRDVKYAVPFLLQCWLFATPVIYSLEAAGPTTRALAALNPMTGVVLAFRAVFLGTELPWGMLGISAAEAVLLLVLGLAGWRRLERYFADVI
jgi:lipopolysaccharide transport system permease protein